MTIFKMRLYDDAFNPTGKALGLMLKTPNAVFTTLIVIKFCNTFDSSDGAVNAAVVTQDVVQEANLIPVMRL